MCVEPKEGMDCALEVAGMEFDEDVGIESIDEDETTAPLYWTKTNLRYYPTHHHWRTWSRQRSMLIQLSTQMTQTRTLSTLVHGPWFARVPSSAQERTNIDTYQVKAVFA